jgi:hypothetical protein
MTSVASVRRPILIRPNSLVVVFHTCLFKATPDFCCEAKPNKVSDQMPMFPEPACLLCFVEVGVEQFRQSHPRAKVYQSECGRRSLSPYHPNGPGSDPKSHWGTIEGDPLSEKSASKACNHLVNLFQLTHFVQLVQNQLELFLVHVQRGNERGGFLGGIRSQRS